MRRTVLLSLAAAVMVCGCATGPLTLEGRILYQGQPINSLTDANAVMWFRDEATGKEYTSAVATYDPATGSYTISNLPRQLMGVSVMVTPAGTQNAYPGKFNTFQDIDFATMWMTSRQKMDISLSRHIHLLQPFDNMGQATFNVYPAHGTPVVFSWEPIPGAAVYRYQVDLYRHDPDYQMVSVKVAAGTAQTSISLDLPRTEAGQHYQFSMNAFDASQHVVGTVMVVYTNGYGWDYRFAVP